MFIPLAFSRGLSRLKISGSNWWLYDYLVVLVLVVVGQGFRCDAENHVVGLFTWF